ncbi:TPA: hypothetical protein L4I34_003134 [Pseudomonas aeruginosa]|uniref:hypothetical protein n=1 Tax=Pseudomonas aeruginosa TaxID=287 RepID=UPI000BA08FCB|nr:hypothetical protein [Pseudomonas aeruginosa]MBN5511571.1 hypothetical protein [Pseudomonas aeruginosa]OZO33906.1 hypothetical protein CGU41_29475 [Pseudomonas aeruginosa]RUG64287.1 hypothetical protein IPC754_04245 [Pseudomonas aeruginosa]HBO2590094.1 hypothetical protein [Pseudomonas aeruginosa]HCF7490840.1 hypothetical protein [Pseudomonas aeruginosa]
MSKRLLLDGVFFSENWSGTLDAAALLAGVDVSRLEFHPDDQLEEVRELRREAYRRESDPIRLEEEFDARRAGRAPDYSAYDAKVEEIKARYPLPEAGGV